MLVARVVLLALAILIPRNVLAANVADLLVMQDIGQFKFMGKGGGIGPGAIGATEHFGNDHTDESYTALYFSDALDVGAKVEVSQHAGSDSDKWLLHEIENGYRDEKTLNATTAANVQMRMINGQNIYFLGIYGGKSYTWLANSSIVVNIDCPNCPNSKPEPLDIVKAYLTKHPSVISMTDAELKSNAHSEKWIKDEMERRLWLADKWFAQIQTADPKLHDKLKSMADSMVVFLNYRQKYFGVALTDEVAALETAFFQNNATALQAKLTEYKAWWASHKSNSITLP